MDKPLVMVVDDEKDFADNITTVINNTGKYEVIAVYSARDALDKLNKNKIMMGTAGNRIKMILLDIKMPDMDGLQFLEELRKIHSEDIIGVIMVTAYYDEEKWARATSGFIVGYIVKPLKEHELMGMLDRYFSGEGEKFKMVLDTFVEHIDKKEAKES